MVTVNTDFALRGQGISNSGGVGNLPRHRWYFVKEAFSPKLVEKAIEFAGARPGEMLLDPFSGSGTVPLVGALSGLNTVAFEVNPFLRFISSTKLRNASAPTFKMDAQALRRALKQQLKSPLEGYSTFTRGNRWGRWLFPTDVLRSFESGLSAIKRASPGSKGLLTLALIGAAMDCCNATRDGKCLRYLKKWEESEASPAQLTEKFLSRADTIEHDLAATRIPPVSARVVEGDARRLLQKVDKKFKLCVTSPPYLNSFDYSDVYRPELFLGRFVKSNSALMKVRLKTVRSHVQASWKPPKKDQFGILYRSCVTRLKERVDHLWDPRLPTMVQAYFEDMESVLAALRTKARQDASVWIIVSTSAYAGVEVPVDLILAEIGQRAGWHLHEVGVLRYLRSSSQHVQHVEETERKAVPLRESVVILTARPNQPASVPTFPLRN